MRIYLQVLDYETWEVICDDPFMSVTKNEVGDDIPKPSSQWSELEKKKMSLNSKVMMPYFVLLIRKNSIEYLVVRVYKKYGTNLRSYMKG